MTTDRNHPSWTAYVLDELDEKERAEFEQVMESTSGAEAILEETRDAVALLREGFACEQPAYLSAEQKRTIEVEAALRVPWFRNRLHWATGVAAVVLAGVVTITVPKLLRLRQPADAEPVVSSVEAPSAVTLPATGSPVSGMDSESRIESDDGIQESPVRASGLAPSEPEATLDIEVVRTTEAESADVLLPPDPSESADESPRAPRQIMARIHGLATDQTGAIIPGVVIVMTREASGQIWRNITNDNGMYSFRILRPGSYRVQGVLPGFKTAIRSGVQIQRERNTRIDLVLEPGAISEQVTVSGRQQLRGVPGALPGGHTSTHMSAPAAVRPDRPGHDVIGRTRFNTEEYDRILDNPFVAVREDPLATFSIDVDTAAYANVRRFLNQFTRPPRDAVRIEEMVNYFAYDYAGPTGQHPVRVHAEVAAAPWTPEHRLVRLGLKGRELPSGTRPPSNLVFLIDVSGSMQDADKLDLLKAGMTLLVNQLGENDRVAIVVYASASGLVLQSTPGDQKRQLLGALDRLAAGGSTNGGAGIELAYNTAVEHFIKGGTNRVILATDGDFNVGVTDEGALTRLIEEKAETGVFLSVLGFGTGNYNDAGLEALAHHGNGNYAYIDTIREARKVLVEQMGGTLITIAKDVKIQVEFNPAKVNAYRLIGYENRVLEHQDFNDDTKDAGEMGSGHTVTALFEVVPAGVEMPLPGVDPLKYQTPNRLSDDAPRAELLTVKVRYKEPDGEVSRLMEVAVTDRDVRLAEASTDFRFAAAVAGFGMILRDSPHKGQATLDSTLRLAETSVGRDEEGYRSEFVELARKAYTFSLHELAANGSVAAIQALLAAGADAKVPDNEGRTPLHWASTNENPAVIEALLAAGADPRVRDSSGATPLRWAIRHENVAAIEALLAAGADPEVLDEYALTPLQWAAKESENPAVIDVLLAAGADVGARGEGVLGTSLLHWASTNENSAVIAALLVAGADPNVPDNEGRTPLHWASTNENPAVIEALLAAGADAKVRDKDGRTPLHEAVGYNTNLEVIEVLLAAADVHARADDGDTPLHWANRNENPAVTEMLLASGADPNARGSYLDTPLHRAALYEDPAPIQALLAAGVDVEARNEGGHTPLPMAADHNRNPLVIEMLLAAGADPMSRHDGGETPLHRAARSNENPAVIQALIAGGAKPNARDDDQETPLHWAVRYGNLAVVRTLLDGGGDLKARDDDGDTPLHWAIRVGKPTVVEVLLAAGADVGARDNGGETPLHWAGREGNPAVIDVLLAAGAEVNAQTEGHCTPLHWATGNNNPAVIQALVVAGADPRARDNHGDTSLHWASTIYDPAVVQAILAAPGADVAARNKDDHTPLHWAAGSNDNPAVIEALVAAGADPNVRDTNGNTSLHWAAGNGNPAVVQMLLAGGANPNLQNKDGHTPLQLATEHNENPAVREILLASGNRQ